MSNPSAAMPTKILIVEDNADLRFMLRRVFETAGFAVEEAANGRFALTLALKSEPAVVVTDIFMPDFEGIETIVAFRNKVPEARIVAMSGRPAMEGYDPLDTARKLGAHATIRKPFMPKDILALVRELLSREAKGSAYSAA